MKTIHAVYENGVFRPLGQVELPDRCEVEFVPTVVQEAPANNESLAAIYEILSRNYETSEADLAARHDEHQP
ncbi:MAG: antitoxin family protein [Pirellulales bacterium]